MLLLRALDAIGTASEYPAAQAVEFALPAHAFHVLTVCSAPVDRAAQSAIHGPLYSMCVALQGLSLVQPYRVDLPSAWEVQMLRTERARSVL